MRTAPTILLGLALVATAAQAFSLEAAYAEADQPHIRNKRLAVTNCVTNPVTSKEQVLEDAKTVQITCTFDTAVETCLWTHVEPIKEGTSSNNNVFDIKCTAASADNGQTCPSDSRVTFQFSGNTCGIQLSSTKNTDTGKWKMSATALSPSGGGIQTTNREIDLWTWNTTKNYLYDRDDKEIREYETTYNYNERENQWEKDKNGWESVEFACRAMGGRPEPKITWYIGSNDRDDLSTDSNFRISQGTIGQVDRYGFITDIESIISFTVNRELMEKLKTYNVDINPRDEIVRFDLTCQTMQGMSSYVQKMPVSMRIRKSYDNGALASDTIGIIVGVIVAVIILVVAIGILLFAKASNRWCFASDDYSYGDARDPKSHPRTVAGGGGRSGGTGGGHHSSSGHQQQVHSVTTDGKKSGLTTAESSSAHSSNSSLSPTKKPIIKNVSSSSSSHTGKWVEPPSSSATQRSAGAASASAPPASTPPPPVHVRSSARSTSSQSTHSNNDTPPPRPKKPTELQYANLDKRAFMHDPRNQVLPQKPPSGRQTPTQYSSIVSPSKLV